MSELRRKLARLGNAGPGGLPAGSGPTGGAVPSVAVPVPVPVPVPVGEPRVNEVSARPHAPLIEVPATGPLTGTTEASLSSPPGLPHAGGAVRGSAVHDESGWTNGPPTSAAGLSPGEGEASPATDAPLSLAATLPPAERGIRAGAAPDETGPPAHAVAGAQDPAAQDLARSLLRERLQRIGERVARGLSPSEASAAAPESGLLGETKESAHGPLHIVYRALAPEHRHGRVRLSDAPSVTSETVSRLTLDESLAGVSLERMLLVDTETTGLAGGTGTLPFLIGLGWFEGGQLHVEQLLLRRPGEERPLLQRLAERIQAASCILTYNGKSYDLPLLRTRFVLNRLAPPPPPPHVDLVHAARRLYRRRMNEVRLSQLEAQVLGFERTGDIPGADIPARYFAFLRGAPASSLNPVIEHNLHDLAALAASLVAMASLVECAVPEAPSPDLLSAAQLALRARAFAEAQRLAEQGLASTGCSKAERRELHALLGRLAQLRREPRVAATHFEKALACGGSANVLAPLHLSLAKLYEHQLRQPERALHHAERGALAESRDVAARRAARLGRWKAAAGATSGLPLLERR